MQYSWTEIPCEQAMHSAVRARQHARGGPAGDMLSSVGGGAGVLGGASFPPPPPSTVSFPGTTAGSVVAPPCVVITGPGSCSTVGGFVAVSLESQPVVSGFDMQYSWTEIPCEQAMHSAVRARQHARGGPAGDMLSSVGGGAGVLGGASFPPPPPATAPLVYGSPGFTIRYPPPVVTIGYGAYEYDPYEYGPYEYDPYEYGLP